MSESEKPGRLLRPMQPIVLDQHSRPRFMANAIVQHLLDHGGISLSDLARLDFSDEDRMQFAQLIGYSVSGYGELHYVSDKSYEAAVEAAKALDDSACP